MRITNKMLADTFLGDMTTNLENMQTIQRQMTSGKEIRKPSDDPFKVARSMQLHTDITSNKQYNENIKDTINWLNVTDTSLGQAGDVLHRVRELLVSTGNPGFTENERRAIKDEINEKVGELSQILNTNFDGKYIFGGTRGNAKPVMSKPGKDANTEIDYYDDTKDDFLQDPPTDPKLKYQKDMIKSKLTTEISQGVTMDYSVNAVELLEYKNGDGTGLDLRKQLKDIINHLDSKDTNEISKLVNDDLQGITDAMNNVLKIRAEVGAKQNRMETAKNKNTDENFNMTEILSKTEDINFTEKSMEYAVTLTVYTASLQTSARVLQPSLMDYVR